MSRWDELDRMSERIDEGRQRISENTQRANNIRDKALQAEDYDKELAIWEALKNKVLLEIREGAVSGDGWKLTNNWVDLSGNRMFRFDEELPSINDERIRNYFLAHRVSISESVIMQVRKYITNMNDINAKNKLKEIIINYRKTGEIDLKMLKESIKGD